MSRKVSISRKTVKIERLYYLKASSLKSVGRVSFQCLTINDDMMLCTVDVNHFQVRICITKCIMMKMRPRFDI